MGSYVEIYRAQYAGVDPNVVTDYCELDDGRHTIVEPNNVQLGMEFLEQYGMIVPVNMPTYSFDAIQKDFCFEKTPKMHANNPSLVVLTDGFKTCSMTKDVLKRYTYYDAHDMYVAIWEKLFDFDNEGLCNTLYNCSLVMSSVAPESGSACRIYRTHIDAICKQYPEASVLYKYFNEDNHCLYLKLHCSDDVA